MFGYILADLDKLNEEDKRSYHGYYCGLCHALSKEHGHIYRFTLNYDLTFVAIILSSIYDSKRETAGSRCIVHPFKRQGYFVNKYINYAASMNIALSYYNLLDNWTDDHNLLSLAESSLIKKELLDIEGQYKRQCSCIKEQLRILSKIEQDNVLNPDLAASCTANMLGEIFAFKEDENYELLKSFGSNLGKYIYILDACIDLRKDLKHKSYNPMISYDRRDFDEILSILLSKITESCKLLPIKDNKEIIDNILYSGIRIKYELFKQKKRIQQ